jgi:anti-anti-sigma factor
VILDLSELTFIDSSGLHVIVTAHARLADAGRRLTLVPGCHQVQRIFELTGIEDRLEFTNTRDGRGLTAIQSK